MLCTNKIKCISIMTGFEGHINRMTEGFGYFDAWRHFRMNGFNQFDGRSTGERNLYTIRQLLIFQFYHFNLE